MSIGIFAFRLAFEKRFLHARRGAINAGGLAPARRPEFRPAQIRTRGDHDRPREAGDASRLPSVGLLTLRGEPPGVAPRPRLHMSWCSRCLAEVFAAGRSAHIRRHWVLAASGFCHAHSWPLEERCAVCRPSRWRFATPAHGPIRMVCEDCWRPLERAVPEALTAERKITVCWGRVIELETEVATALSGKTPDQFRFNFTSANQLLNEVRDICELLACSHRCFARRTCR